MRKWTTSACVVLAWCTLPLAAAAGLRVTGPAQAITSTATISSTATVSSTAASTAATSTAAANSTAATSSSTAAASSSTAATSSSTAAAGAAPGTTRLTLASYPAAAGPASITRRAARPAAPARVTAAPRPAATWTVRPGDTLSAIAAALAVPGGWPALYAANRRAVGPDPALIRPGTVLALPGPAAPARYTVAPGDTLSAIAAALRVPGGWPALYAANRPAIGPDPALIRPGTVLTAPRKATTPAAPPRQAGPRPAGPRPAAPGGPPAPATHRTARPAPPASQGAPPRPVYQAAPGQAPPAQAQPGHLTAPGPLTATVGMPRWLLDLLLAAGVLAATAFAAEPAAAIARRRKATTPGTASRPGPTTQPDNNTRPGGNAHPGTTDRPARASRLVPAQRSAPASKHGAAGWLASVPRPGRRPGRAARPGRARLLASKARIILADHARLIVTYCPGDHTVYVLSPPGEDPRAVLAAARLVVPEDSYQDLADRLGVPSAWPLE